MIQQEQPKELVKGRGAQSNPSNRFHAEAYAIEHPEAIDDWEKEKINTEYFQESGKTVLNKVTSPDIPLAYSLNPYQGCEHGCVYCYARNSHEYWGFSAGVDFESKIVVKRRAPELLRELFSSRKWQPTPISLSGNTDCYQPIERKMGITRKILEVCLDYKNPVGIITKNALILRDLDLLQELAKHNLVSVFTSITSMDEDLRRKLEPRTSKYTDRLKIIETLSKEGIHCGVMNAPIIPGLNDNHMYEVLRRSSMAGAKSAGYTMVRLNGAIGPIFKDWLSLTFPDRAQKVWNLISDAHGGDVNDSRFGVRMKGEGNLAEMIEQQFKLYCRQFKLNEEKFEYNISDFVKLRPGQLRLF
ncbi:MAG: PA0069 family radical SAM protein [Chitinophagaceae bacterium]|nr:PA0069 family radical SAM protein [Chitinophagaceae bacterium]